MAERERVMARVASLHAELRDILESASSTTADDEHDPEGATIGFERAQAAALLASAQAQLAEIDAAVARLSGGRYGICDDCGGAIGAERLAVLPTTQRCVACASRAARRP
jgi:RNA polymerase-binding transcription factor DksA